MATTNRNLGETVLRFIREGKLVVSQEQLQEHKYQDIWDDDVKVFADNLENHFSYAYMAYPQEVY